MMNEDFEFSGDIDQLKASAEAGDAEAQFKLGVLYEKGRGVKRDQAQAFYWYGKAAAQGCAKAQTNLGYCYESGQGTKRDLEEAFYWYHKAAERGEVYAQTYLGHYYENSRDARQERDQAAYWYGKAAKQGHAQAQFKLGYYYEKGIGVQRDWAQAADWYRRAAEQGHTDAQNKLSECYYNGTGVEQDEKQAVYWYHKAAGLGDAQTDSELFSNESRPKGENGRGEAEPVGPFMVILKIAMFAFGAVFPFVMPEAIGVTPVCQFIIAYLYAFAVVIAVGLDKILDTIGKQALSIILLLYFLSWAASIVFGLLFANGTAEIAVNGMSGIWMIFFPIMFWEVISGVKYFKDHWQDW